MEFDFDKLITYKNANKAEIGKEYYFFNDIDDDIIQGDFNDISKDKLEEINKEYAGSAFKTQGLVFTFIYPVEEKRYLTYEELKERWLKNPTELYCFKDDLIEMTGMITAFKDNFKIFVLGGYPFTETTDDVIVDNRLIRNLTDINGNPLVKE